MTKRRKRARERGGASCPCPVCHKPTRVLQTRRREDGSGSVVRWRQCLSCQETFTTREEAVRPAAE